MAMKSSAISAVAIGYFIKEIKILKTGLETLAIWAWCPLVVFDSPKFLLLFL